MASLKAPITLTDGINIRYVSNSVLRIILIQSIFSITKSDLYLEGFSKNIYLPNAQGEFPEIYEDILLIQPIANLIDPVTIIVNNTDSRYLCDTLDFNPAHDFILTGYSTANKFLTRSLIKFDQLESLKGKKILKAYLYLTGRIRDSVSFADPKVLFIHQVIESYGNILKFANMPKYNPKPEASIIVEETKEEIFSIDITSLVVNWVGGRYPNYGIMLKGNDKIGVENLKSYLRTNKPPQLRVICLPDKPK